ncbi:MAG: SPFH domain-containing protein [Streptococcaceae bacterium]|jgi:regulator of protease activity HflC (stomatin/prohibitin superfamily)|nr:SPFH domain-containing protein [Streptococcaceae bacterium]
MTFLVLISIAIFLGLIIGLTTVFVVNQQSVYIIERLGKFLKTTNAGIHVRIPFGIDCIVAKVNLRVRQSELIIETKTQDNVFVKMALAVQFKVDANNISASYYELFSPLDQIKSYVEDAIRSSLPKYTLDAAYEKKDEIALDVYNVVGAEMKEYGYIVIKTLITSIEPDSKVKDSMNEINAAQRTRAAAQELAEADRIKVVTAAKAEAEKDRLHGVGLADQRKAIVDGLATSFTELKETGLSEKEVMSILLTNQYLDILNAFAKGGNHAIFLPAGASGAEDLRTQLLSALEANKNLK